MQLIEFAVTNRAASIRCASSRGHLRVRDFLSRSTRSASCLRAGRRRGERLAADAARSFDSLALARWQDRARSEPSMIPRSGIDQGTRNVIRRLSRFLAAVVRQHGLPKDLSRSLPVRKEVLSLFVRSFHQPARHRRGSRCTHPVDVVSPTSPHFSAH